MIKYKLKNNEDGILRQIIRINENGKNTFIPIDEANAVYQEYLEWVAEGNTPEPADE